MKKVLLSIVGTCLLGFLLADPAFPNVSLQFDFDGNPSTWESEWNLNLNATVQVDVYLVKDAPGDPIEYSEVFYRFCWDQKVIKVNDVWANDDPMGGPWGSSYKQLLDTCYDLGVSASWPSCVTLIDNKMLLHSIVLECIGGGDGLIEVRNGEIYDCDGNDYMGGILSATIHGPCAIKMDPDLDPEIDPETDPDIDPESFNDRRPNETIQFSVSEEGNCNVASYGWEVTPGCGSNITVNGLYTAGNVDFDCTDTVTVKDTNNNLQASATVDIMPFITITPQNQTTGSGSRIVFKGVNNGFCENTPVYSWSVESDIGSKISEGNTLGAKGYYQAGKKFDECEDATDTVVLTADCNGNLITADTNVTIPPCVVTISPKNPSPVESEKTIQFKATPNECCENDPCYTWSVSAEGTTGNTFNTSSSKATSGAVMVSIQSIAAPVYTWAMSAAGDTANTACGVINNNGFYRAGKCTGTDIVTVTDTCNNNATDIAVVAISTTSTTTTVPPPRECLLNEDCDDGSFCNGEEKCVSFKCQPGSKPCLDDGQYCNGVEIGCDEEDDVCLHSGDPCTPDLVCDEDNDICTGCLADADCDDELFCNGEEKCVDNVCRPGEPVICNDDGLFCSGEEVCDETKDACVSSGFPCAQPTPICNEYEDTCEEIVTPPSVLVEPDLLQSHLIPLPAFLTITGQDGAQFDSSSTVSYNPDNALWALPPMVLDNEQIFVLGLLMPQWVTGSLPTVSITVTTGSQEPVTGNVIVTLLPFILGDERVQ